MWIELPPRRRRTFEAVRDVYEEKRSFAQRVTVAVVLVLLMVGLLVGKLVGIQLLQHDYYSTRADANRTRLVPVAPVRGLIYDRNGVVLAQNQASFVLEITPEKVQGLDDTLKRLASDVRITDRDIARFKDRMRRTPRYRAVPLRTHLSLEEVARFEQDRYEYQGVEVSAQLSREYPMDTQTAHLIGYVGGISEADYANLDPDQYQGLNQIGKSGIEQSHEDELRGSPGSKVMEVNADGRPLNELGYRPGKGGKDLVLSIDARLQSVTVQEFADLDGAAVAIDPKTGEVLALVSTPGFSPAPFVDGIDNDSYQALLSDPRRPLYNRAVLGTYPSGSTIKPFLGIAGLYYGAISTTKTIFDPGYFQLPGVARKYRCDRRSGHGWLALDQAIAQSCDVYFYQTAVNLGIDHIDEMLARFGFGKLTGVDIPNEKAGILPSREWKRRVYRQNWYLGETVNMGVGQGYFTVTPMELAQAAARLSTRGGGFKPHLVHASIDTATGEKREQLPEALPPISDVAPAIYDEVIRAMGMATQGPTGTAYAVFKDAPYTVGGKTGTAQVAGLRQDEAYAPKIDRIPKHLRDHALFIAFAPITDPKIAVAVIVEHAGFGATSAAPIARQMIDQYLLGKVLFRAPQPVVLATPEEQAPADADDAVPDPAPPAQ
ncbi:MAG: penicillin-binding protein 2 [Hydrocarboniphaga sp.]|uniref:penicillin-binding protein 2 n=1 Tax=Hydrocarboniphaga sp. TaxID=2033016 RepID=UPI00262E7FB6|nr:penicillin-binding protein 2 [Hydrocarboniphaga sp.]MDB5970842.1 penicillin-binding protein 2 [Hydrocarboniphaga sp.]